MSEIDSIKEEINSYRSLLQIMLTALFAVTGWFMLYDNIQDVKAGMALVAIVSLSVIVIVFYLRMGKLISKLKEL